MNRFRTLLALVVLGSVYTVVKNAQLSVTPLDEFDSLDISAPQVPPVALGGIER